VTVPLPDSHPARLDGTDAGEGGRGANTAADVRADAEDGPSTPYQSALPAARAAGDPGGVQVARRLAEDGVRAFVAVRGRRGGGGECRGGGGGDGEGWVG
jgi:hypothetical protein